MQDEQDEMQWEAWHQDLLKRAGGFPIPTITDDFIQQDIQKYFGPGGALEQITKLAINRKILGYFRYEQKASDNLSYDEKARRGLAKTYIERAEEKLALYTETGNAEFLVDCFNYCLLEWTKPYHPNYHFKAEDRDE